MTKIDRRRIGAFSQLGGVSRYTLRGGREDGRQMLEIDTGRIRFSLFEDGCLDIYRFAYRGTNLSFLTKNGIFTPPAPFPQRFPGGMLYTCGMESVGDRPGEATHGRLHSLPMTLERLLDGSGAGKDEGVILVQGRTADTALFGQNIRFTRRIETAIGSSRVRIVDTVRNEGFSPFPLCLLYHVNVGYPLLDEGAKLYANVSESVGRTKFAAAHLDKWSMMEAPEDEMFEQVFYHRSVDGMARVENRLLGIALNVRFDPAAMPWMLEWKSRGSGDYALGIEPSTTRLDGDFERQTLLPGEERHFFLELEAEDLPKGV